MKLSEAIRLGSMMKAQAFGGYLRHPKSVDAPGDVLGLRQLPFRSCALGAAADAVGGLTRFNPAVEDALESRWLSLLKYPARCPLCADAACDVSEVVPHLNDRHRWTREQIADWVATVEAAQDHCEPPSVVAVREETEQPFVPLRA